MIRIVKARRYAHKMCAYWEGPYTTLDVEYDEDDAEGDDE